MYTLFIDTHKETRIGLLRDKKQLKLITDESKQQSIIVMPILENLLKEFNLELSQVNEIIVVTGPGSFTGVRLGVTIAKTIAYCLNIPIKTITSIQLMAIMDSSDKDKIYAVLDAKGAYMAKFDDKKNIDGNYEYLPNSEPEELNLVTNVTYDLNKFYENEDQLIPTDAHLVNPFYVKKIEVEK